METKNEDPGMIQDSDKRTGMLRTTGSVLLHRLPGLLPGLCYVVELQPRYRITHMSGALMQLLGWKDSTLRMEDRDAMIQQLIYPEDIESFTNKLKQLKNSQTAVLQTLEYRVIVADTVKWVQDKFIGLWDEAGNLIGMEGYISEIPSVELRTQFVNHLVAYRDAINVNMISSMTDEHGVITFVNRKFCEVSQYDESELMYKNHNIISSGLHPKSFFTEMWKTISSGRVWHGEIVNKAKDGSLYWVDSVIIPIYDEHHKITNYLSLRKVITDRKQAEKQKDKHLGMLENIAYSLAHRFRSPVCSILGLTNLIAMRETLEQPELTEEIVKHLSKSVTELEKFTQELSDKLYAMETELRNA